MEEDEKDGLPAGMVNSMPAPEAAAAGPKEVQRCLEHGLVLGPDGSCIKCRQQAGEIIGDEPKSGIGFPTLVFIGLGLVTAVFIGLFWKHQTNLQKYRDSANISAPDPEPTD